MYLGVRTRGTRKGTHGQTEACRHPLSRTQEWQIQGDCCRPSRLQGKLGTKLKRPLNTDSRATANTLKWAVVAELKAIVDRAGRDAPQGDHLTREALELATHRVTVRDDQELAQLDEEIVRRADEMLGDPVATEADPDTGDPVYIYDAGRESAAGLFAAMASGRATPIGYHHGDFLAQSLTKARTKSDDRRAIAFLSAWCDQTSTPATLEAITSLRTSSSVKGRSNSSCGVAGSGILILSHTSASTSSR